MRHVNQIILIGRLSGEPEWRALPGGGEVAVWRLVVEHEDARSPQDAIDTIRCISFDPSVQASVRDLRHGDLVEVRGSLRHRFWRGPSGPRGVYEVEAATVMVHRRATVPDGGSPPARRTTRARPADADHTDATTTDTTMTDATTTDGATTDTTTTDTTTTAHTGESSTVTTGTTAKTPAASGE